MTLRTALNDWIVTKEIPDFAVCRSPAGSAPGENIRENVVTLTLASSVSYNFRCALFTALHKLYENIINK